jgi:hypothetical protein
LAEPARSVDPRHFLAATTPNFKPHSPSDARPAPWRPPDDVSQSDLEYFAARPDARHRVRANFRGEFSRFLIVIATVVRDDAGQPITTTRDFYRFDGGNA